MGPGCGPVDHKINCRMVQLVAAMRKFEPVKARYQDRVRSKKEKQVTRGEVQALAKGIEQAVSIGRIRASSAQ